MLTCTRLEVADRIQRRNTDYTRTLADPMDGMWENAVIARAAFWEIYDQSQYAGYFCLNTENCLLRFHLQEDYRQRAQEIFSWIISTCRIQHAIASTIEPLYFSLCLDFQQSMSLHSYLFRDQKRITLSSHLEQSTLRKAEEKDWDDVLHFYQANTEGPGDWIEGFLHRRFDREELFVFSEQQRVVAMGECITSQQQPYADLGMVVARSYRGRGIGSFLLAQLKMYCYDKGWTPICSCEARNYASKKAIEKAGFISEQRMMSVVLSNEISL
jgi:GNAT superfamily N-acetyltransferase